MTRYIVVYTVHISLLIIALYISLRSFPLKQLLENTWECIRIKALASKCTKSMYIYKKFGGTKSFVKLY